MDDSGTDMANKIERSCYFASILTSLATGGHFWRYFSGLRCWGQRWLAQQRGASFQQCLKNQCQAGFEVFRGQTLEARPRKALQTPNEKGGQHRRLHLRIHRGRGRATQPGSTAQALLETGLDLVKKLVHALL